MRLGGRLGVAAWLAAVWVLLWGQLTVANVAGGIVASGFVLYLYPVRRPDAVPLVRPLTMIRLAAFASWVLIRSTFQVAVLVLGPKGRIRRGLVFVPLRGCSADVVLLVANTVSLSPGTLTVDVSDDNAALLVHALDAGDPPALQRDMLRLESLAIAALGTRDDRIRLAETEEEPSPARLIERF